MFVRKTREVMFLVLSALGTDNRDGSGIIAEVSASSAGRVRLRAGTLFPALDRLSADRLIAVDREEIVNRRLRRYYRLTPAGRERLSALATTHRTRTVNDTRTERQSP
jgi:DNA-binding PadR family transcriptional regulator